MIQATPFSGFSIRSFSSTLTRNFQPGGSCLEIALAGSDKFLVGMFGMDAQLESLEDPGVAIGIIEQQDFGALVPAQRALAGDGYRLVGDALVHIAIAFLHVELGHPCRFDAIEGLYLADFDIGPVGRPQFRAVEGGADDAEFALDLAEIKAYQLLRSGISRRGMPLGVNMVLKQAATSFLLLGSGAARKELDIACHVHIYRHALIWR